MTLFSTTTFLTTKNQAFQALLDARKTPGNHLSFFFFCFLITACTWKEAGSPYIIYFSTGRWAYGENKKHFVL